MANKKYKQIKETKTKKMKNSKQKEIHSNKQKGNNQNLKKTQILQPKTNKKWNTTASKKGTNTI